MSKVVSIIIINLIGFQLFAQNIGMDTIVKEGARIPVTINYGNLIIQTIPSDVMIEIPKLGINEEKDQDSLILKEIYTGLYDLSFKFKNETFKCFVEVFNEQTVHILVDVNEKKLETNVIVNNPLLSEPDPIDLDMVYVMVEEMPEFPGGILELRKWIKSNVKYPESARRKYITGRVYIGFVINKEGKVEDGKVLRSIDPALDREALRVISNMPNWKPGKQRGKSVKVSYTFPINFHLHR
ncbi:energy transducer TonB [Ancylomarina euxinus]|uniref:Energy transducer TonB n=1 Tax=Ancylomarina euxinus TaxID=2283627 RepID=A0A425XWC0_9BACT|nr:energy transducer TonB [Ancylomarina euxinus]MCZ4696503.1 energy transducer TonB [Ancylomarina euxinus]MUP16855.1 TonB family protein [Ancylomarina euxinus]RRG18919.1 energy transducer TonB [Ancylomarina euxinus]